VGTRAGRDSRTQPAADRPGCTLRVDGIELALHVQPGARRNALVGTQGDRLKLAVTAPPADGRANAAVCALLAHLLGVPPRDLVLVAGASARHKRVRVSGPPQVLRARLDAALQPAGAASPG
jgi:hypothetical protein